MSLKTTLDTLKGYFSNGKALDALKLGGTLAADYAKKTDITAAITALGAGDVEGSGTSTLGNVAVYADATGKKIKDGGAVDPAGTAASKAATAKSEAISAAASDATTKANNAQSAAISAAASDATTKANAAQSAAQSYTDNYSPMVRTTGDQLIIGVKNFRSLNADGFPVSAFSLSTDATDSVFPLGSIILMSTGLSAYNLNQAVSPYNNAGSFSLSGGSAIPGTWRSRGAIYQSSYITLIQRVA